MPIPTASPMRTSRQVSLRVLRDRRSPPAGRLPRLRATAMVAVYILMIGHVLQWRLTGRTVSPLVGSDAMYTLEQGQINGGCLLLSAALLVTLVGGRFLCGWACHMGGLQDGCAWLLRRIGIRPRLFRARLLSLVPLGLGAYMFIWPTLRRELLAPALRAWWPAALGYVGETAAFPGFSNHLMTDDLWGKLPGVVVAVPFLLVCGAATVYFLGARGLCRYGCPYGGLMSPLEQFAPIRVAVDLAACDRCGLCTAACDSGVRVMDEVQNYGRVVSRHCTKSLDCVDVCPRGALSLGWARPALFKGRGTGARPAASYDLTWPEELLVACAFIAAFVILRGLYGLIPMLMAVGMAGCTAFVAWKTWRLARERDSRFARWQLKLAGRLRPAGIVWVLSAAITAGLLLHSAAVRLAIWRAGILEDPVTATRDVVFSGQLGAIPAAQIRAAGRALAWYDAAASWTDGGWALAGTPEADVRRSWLRLVRGEYGRSEQLQTRVMARLGASDAACADRARTIMLQGEANRAQEFLQSTFEAHPAYEQTRDLLALLHARAGRTDLAEAIYTQVLRQNPTNARARATRANLFLGQQRIPEAISELTQAAADSPRDVRIRHHLAIARFLGADVEGALSDLEAATQLDGASAPAMFDRGAEMLDQLGRSAEAQKWRDRARAITSQAVTRGNSQ